MQMHNKIHQFYQQAIFQNLNNRQQATVLNAQQSFSDGYTTGINEQQTEV